MSTISNIDNDWETFFQKGEQDMMTYDNVKNKEVNCFTHVDTDASRSKCNVECSPLYVSTKTVIGYLNIKENVMIDIMRLFWEIPILDYHIHREGILKKQIKLSTTSIEEIESVKSRVDLIDNGKLILLSKPSSNPNNQKQTYKINIGLNKKDMTSYRKKEKNVFYNCFALIIRIKINDEFKEIHLKLFNTGKMEIPGIQNDNMLFDTIKIMTNIIHPFLLEQNCIDSHNPDDLFYKNSINTVFINSNFNCGYYIKRNDMFDLLRDEYNIICLYDPCSYPGIQAKFYYNDKTQNGTFSGQCKCFTRCGKKNGDCTEISFMIFRTGSVLILGHCEFKVIEIIYDFLKNIFHTHYDILNDGIVKLDEKTKKPRTIKKKIIVSKSQS